MRRLLTVCLLLALAAAAPLAAQSVAPRVFLEARVGAAVPTFDMPANSAGRMYFYVVTDPNDAALTRLPQAAETKRLVDLHQKVRADMGKSPKEALQLATDPLGPLPAGMDLPVRGATSSR